MSAVPPTALEPLADELPSLYAERSTAPSFNRTAVIGSVLAHLLLGVFALTLPELDVRPVRLEPEPMVRRVTPLVLPPLTQRAPNTRALSKDVTLDSLVAPQRPAATPLPPRPSIPRPATPQMAVRTPPPGVPAPKPVPTITPSPAPPKIEVAETRPPTGPMPALGNSSQGLAAPPPPPVQQRPKLAFETPGSDTGAETGRGAGRLAVPKPTVDEAIRSVARGGGGGASVGDTPDGGSLGGLPSAPSQQRLGSNLELLSDPQGVDFKPYLIRVLAAVRRNWFSVVPESARLGRKGRTTIIFSIDREGRVPKLVISSPSGAEALDRAAVAGISASNPFQPLPREFQGDQIRVQLNFLYNIP